MKNVVFVRVLTLFVIWSNPGLTKGISVILDEKGTLGALVLEQVAPSCSGCFRGPVKRK